MSDQVHCESTKGELKLQSIKNNTVITLFYYYESVLAQKEIEKRCSNWMLLHDNI